MSAIMPINVGTNKQYTVNNIQLAGQDNGNYSVITNFLDNNGYHS